MPQHTPDTRLIETGIWPQAALAALRQAAIETVGGVLGAAATEAGRKALAEHTGLDAATLARLLHVTAAGLSPADRSRLSSPADTSGYGLGALPPKTD